MTATATGDVLVQLRALVTSAVAVMHGSVTCAVLVATPTLGCHVRQVVGPQAGPQRCHTRYVWCPCLGRRLEESVSLDDKRAFPFRVYGPR
jgi:hypothetical protein